MISAEVHWTVLNRGMLNYIELTSSQLYEIEQSCTELDLSLIVMNRTELHWTELRWTELTWSKLISGLNWNGMSWSKITWLNNAMNCTELIQTELN